MKESKKVVLVIVEGTIDADSFSQIFKKIFKNDRVYFHIVHGDITWRPNTSPSNIKEKITECIKKVLNRTRFKKNDIRRIIHLIDTDGTFIPLENILEVDNKRIGYFDDRIETSNREYIISRNLTKASVIKALVEHEKIYGIDYNIYYFSRNLEHVLHNVRESIDSSYKHELCDYFIENYCKKTHEFLNFINKSEFSVDGNYKETWKYIEIDTNSLKRHSNFHLAFENEI